jgi:ribosomal protein L28
MGRLMWQEGLSTERRTSMNLQSVLVVTEKKVLKVRYSAFTIRNLNPYESKVFYEFLPKTTDL